MLRGCELEPATRLASGLQGRHVFAPATAPIADRREAGVGRDAAFGWESDVCVAPLSMAQRSHTTARSLHLIRPLRRCLDVVWVLSIALLVIQIPKSRGLASMFGGLALLLRCSHRRVGVGDVPAHRCRRFAIADSSVPKLGNADILCLGGLRRCAFDTFRPCMGGRARAQRCEARSSLPLGPQALPLAR